MSTGEIIAIAKLSFQIAPFFVLGYFALRFIIYSPDGPNLDKVYTRYFGGRRKKKYAQFTRNFGLILLVPFGLHAYFIFWPMVADLLK